MLTHRTHPMPINATRAPALLWKTNTFQRLLAYAGRTSKPVIAVTNLWPVG
jgi:hypothetical protein